MYNDNSQQKAAVAPWASGRIRGVVRRVPYDDLAAAERGRPCHPQTIDEWL